jgi:hypothetical protein
MNYEKGGRKSVRLEQPIKLAALFACRLSPPFSGALLLNKRINKGKITIILTLININYCSFSCSHLIFGLGLVLMIYKT